MALRTFEGIHPSLAEGAWVDETALLIGDVSLAEDASVWPMVVARGDIHSITIGRRSNIQDSCILHVTHAGEFTPEGHSLTIGENVTVGHGAILHGCDIADNCLIGMSAIIMDGAVIPEYTVVGAGTLVSPHKVLEPGYLWLGHPARRIRVLTDKERDYFRYSANHYVSLKDRHRQSNG